MDTKHSPPTPRIQPLRAYVRRSKPSSANPSAPPLPSANTGLAGRIPLLLFASTALIVALLFVYFFFKVHTVRVTDVQGRPVVIKGVEELDGLSLLTLNAASVEHMLKKANPDIQSAVVSRIFAQTVKVQITRYLPVAYYEYAPDKFAILSYDATVIAYAYERPNLTDITHYQAIGSGELKLGKRVPFADMQFAAALANEIQSYSASPVRIVVQDTHLIEILLGNTTIKAAVSEDMGRQKRYLRQMLQELRRQGNAIKTIDLRFEKIVVEKW